MKKASFLFRASFSCSKFPKLEIHRIYIMYLLVVSKSKYTSQLMKMIQHNGPMARPPTADSGFLVTFIKGRFSRWCVYLLASHGISHYKNCVHFKKFTKPLASDLKFAYYSQLGIYKSLRTIFVPWLAYFFILFQMRFHAI